MDPGGPGAPAGRGCRLIKRSSDAASITQAASILRGGGVVAFPTETVYGLGADATNAHAVAKIFTVKGRPRFDPLIVHVASREEACSLWRRCPESARKLMERFWPGPLTIVLPKTDRIPDLVTAGLPTVAVRVPDHDVALRLIRAAGCPIAAPSANRFGGVSPTTAQAVREELGESAGLILNGGPTRVGIESTVVAFRGNLPVVLRPGGVPVEAIREISGRVIFGPVSPNRPEAPGMLSRHYAPKTPLYLLAAAESVPARVQSIPAAGRRWGLLSFGAVPGGSVFERVEALSRRGDLVEAASRFFGCLRRLDRLGLDAIVAVPLPEQGLGLALMDRLRRAAQGRAFIAQDRYPVLWHGFVGRNMLRWSAPETERGARGGLLSGLSLQTRR